MLRILKSLVVLLILVVVALPFVLLAAGLQPEPLVPVGGKPTPAEVARAKALLKQFDPRAKDGAELRSVEVPEQDLTFVIDYAVGQLVPGGAAVDLQPGGATVSLTLQVPDNPLGRYLNLRLELIQVAGGLDVATLRVGNLEVPGVLARAVGWLAREALQRDETARALLAGVNGFRVSDDRLVVVYQWQPDLLDRVKSKGRTLLLDAADRERLLAYSARIAALTGKTRLGGRMPLTDLLGAVFDEARQRTTAPGDAAAENRAALVAMMLYVQGVDVPRLVGEAADPRYRGKARGLTLRGRGDLAQHFLISAGIAAAGGSRLADAVGLFKELDDSHAGSGFSFTDLAANRAGVRLAETATGPAAARVQHLLADRPQESLFMPAVKDLPERMTEEELVRRFGGVGDPRYRQVVDDIERRIAALEIHRGSR